MAIDESYNECTKLPEHAEIKALLQDLGKVDIQTERLLAAEYLADKRLLVIGGPGTSGCLGATLAAGRCTRCTQSTRSYLAAGCCC